MIGKEQIHSVIIKWLILSDVESDDQRCACFSCSAVAFSTEVGKGFAAGTFKNDSYRAFARTG